MKLKNITVQVGGFHDHWLRNSTDTSGLLTAIASRFHYDFICIMDHDYYNKALVIKAQVEKWIPGFKVHIGHERMYDWGHIVSVENEGAEYDTKNPDFYEELTKARKTPGILVFGHIMHATSRDTVVAAGHLDKLIDGEYVDAVQIERAEDVNAIADRLKAGKKTAIVSGFDSHQLVKVKDLPNCLYNDRSQLLDHIDCYALRGFRTIVFSDNNSWQSIQKALKEGKAVVENVFDKKVYGSQYLIDLLIENGYFEKMEELDRPYDELIIERDPLVAGEDETLKFPIEGKVTLPVNSNLDTVTVNTDENGVVNFKNVPMPCDHDDSYLPVKLESKIGTRVWAIKVENTIQIDAVPYYTDMKKTIRLILGRDFEGKIEFTKPYALTKEVKGKCGDTVLIYDLKEDKQFYEYAFKAYANNGITRSYKGRAAMVKATPFNPEWEGCDVIAINDGKFSVREYGTKRPYPGEDVFSVKVRFQWDSEYFYAKYDIVDKNFFPALPNKKYFDSDATFLSLDPEMRRSKLRDKNNNTIQLSTVMQNGKAAFAWENKDWIYDGEKGTSLKYEFNDKGRTVTIKYPWKLITENPVIKGMTMGMQTGVLNCEECGPIDNINWPWPSVGAMLFPCDWAVIGLM